METEIICPVKGCLAQTLVNTGAEKGHNVFSL